MGGQQAGVADREARQEQRAMDMGTKLVTHYGRKLTNSSKTAEEKKVHAIYECTEMVDGVRRNAKTRVETTRHAARRFAQECQTRHTARARSSMPTGRINKG